MGDGKKESEKKKDAAEDQPIVIKAPEKGAEAEKGGDIKEIEDSWDKLMAKLDEISETLRKACETGKDADKGAVKKTDETQEQPAGKGK